MKGFIEITRNDNKKQELIAVNNIVSTCGNEIMTRGSLLDEEVRITYIVRTIHTYEELKQKIAEAVK